MFITYITAVNDSVKPKKILHTAHYSPSKKDRSCADKPPGFVPLAAPPGLNVLVLPLPFGGDIVLPKSHASNNESAVAVPAFDAEEPVFIGARFVAGGGDMVALRP